MLDQDLVLDNIELTIEELKEISVEVFIRTPRDLSITERKCFLFPFENEEADIDSYN